jgi:hypothetical protein
MNVLNDGTRVVTFGELWSEIGGGTKFTQDQIIRMLANSMDVNENFNIVHYGTRYVVLLDTIKEYFRINPRPDQPISTTEKLKKAERELEEARLEIAALKAGITPHIPRPTNVTYSPQSNSGQSTSTLDDFSKVGIEIDPNSLPREKTDFSKIQNELKDGLNKVRPVRNK